MVRQSRSETKPQGADEWSDGEGVGLRVRSLFLVPESPALGLRTLAGADGFGLRDEHVVVAALAVIHVELRLLGRGNRGTVRRLDPLGVRLTDGLDRCRFGLGDRLQQLDHADEALPHRLHLRPHEVPSGDRRAEHALGIRPGLEEDPLGLVAQLIRVGLGGSTQPIGLDPRLPEHLLAVGAEALALLLGLSANSLGVGLGLPTDAPRFLSGFLDLAVRLLGGLPAELLGLKARRGRSSSATCEAIAP